MYKRANCEREVPDHLWHVGDAISFFAGPLGRNDIHAHSTAVLLAGLYGDLRIRCEGGSWLRCPAAVIPAGVSYEFDMAGAPLSVLYVEPEMAGVHTLASRISGGSEIGGALAGSFLDVSVFRALYEQRATPAEMEGALLDFVRFSKTKSRKEIDQRICIVLAQLTDQCEQSEAAASLAKQAGLSVSRFQHLFSKEVGVPFRRYRTWQRLRRAIREVSNGSSYVAAALTAGFYDQAHFSREFRRTFGAPASRGLRSR